MHLLAEYDPDILDIKEQYPLLPWEETQEIARREGIRYPIIPGTKTPCILTTDFVFSYKDPNGIRIVAVSVKPNRELSIRAQQKLYLEYKYWHNRGITWALMTEESIPQTRVHNLAFFEKAMRNDEAVRSGIDPTQFAEAFESEWAPEKMYIDILKRTSQRFKVDVNIGHNILGVAIWKRKSRIDIDKTRIGHREMISLKSISK